MLFFPVGDTAITTSTLFPQRVQSFAKFLAPVLAATSVFDFPDMISSSFQIYIYEKSHKNPVHIRNAHNSLIMYPLL